MIRKKKILVAPLDWGLGHATRCIPVIRELLAQDANVAIAADKRPYDLLKREFPSLEFIRLPGYAIKYPIGDGIAAEMIRQIPKIVFVTYQEHRSLRKLIQESQFDAVISDNRFGLYSRKIPCAYITHQVRIIMPRQFQWVSQLVYRLNKFTIERYSECWIPDYRGEENLSGKLSHGDPIPRNASFIGPLTRFKILPDMKREFDVLVVLSGPEPQRTAFENILMEQLKNVKLNVLFVRGIPEKSQRIKLSESISVVSSLDSKALNIAMLTSDLIISRPGYSTIMDIAALGCKAVLIPTPGQTEQEYLAGELERKKLFFVQRQENFDLLEALNQSKNYTGFARNEFDNSTLRETVRRFLMRIN